MPGTTSFFTWFYYGLSGLGGWFIFLLLAMIAVIWLLYDSMNRRLPALGWRMGIILTAALLLPAILYRFTVTDLTDMVTSPLAPFAEPIFYLGVLGGILPVVLAIGYYVSYQGMVGCPNGHVYEAIAGRCPECAPHGVVVPPIVPPRPPEPRPERGGRPGRIPPKAHAWLIARDGRDHQLNQGVTTIGRSAQNDICLIGDTTMSNNHAKIVEQNGHYRLNDLASTNGTRVNNRLVREPVLLEPDDEIQFGDNTVVRFVTSRR